jgi:hypothetical protein
MIPSPDQFPTESYGTVEFRIGVIEPPANSIGHSGIVGDSLVLNVSLGDPCFRLSDLSFCSCKHVYASFDDPGLRYRAEALWQRLNSLDIKPLDFLLEGPDFVFFQNFYTGALLKVPH